MSSSRSEIAMPEESPVGRAGAPDDSFEEWERLSEIGWLLHCDAGTLGTCSPQAALGCVVVETVFVNRRSRIGSGNAEAFETEGLKVAEQLRVAASRRIMLPTVRAPASCRAPRTTRRPAR